MSKKYFCIVVAPVFFSASIYSIASVLTNFYGRRYTPLPPKLILWGFVSCDIVATILQIAGAALVGTAYSNREDPTDYNTILFSGLCVQVVSFALFLIVLVCILVKARSSIHSVSRRFLVAFVVAALAVYLRTCFRLAETAQGLESDLANQEVYFGCLEFAPMVVAVGLLIYAHPGRWLKGVSMVKVTDSPA